MRKIIALGRGCFSAMALYCLTVVTCSQIACGQSVDDDIILPDSIISDIEKQDLPVVSRYYFAHQYLSVVAPEIEESDGALFEDVTNLNTLTPMMNGFRSPYTDSEITVETFEHDGKAVYVWSFPEPHHLREALYVAFFPYDGAYRAVAISIGQMVDWEISISDERMRQTFGRVAKPETPRECFNVLLERGAMHERIIPGEFFQEGYVCPEYDL